MTKRILLAHGGGGRLSRQLIDREIVSRFGGGALDGLPDAATLEVTGPLVFSTDSFVVQPTEFPGGNIGHLAVHGTVNDLAVAGGRPRWLSLGLILEEGLEVSLLRRVLDSLAEAADDCQVKVVTGDTKVVRRGQCDGIYINTAGIGEVLGGFNLHASSLRPGDAVLVSGPLGDHGMAVMAAREALVSSGSPQSDTGPVHRLVAAAQPSAKHVRFMRDPTRGGLAAVLGEMVEDRGVGIEIDESALPFSAPACALAEMLGLELLHVASEGRVVLICDPCAADAIVAAWRSMPEGQGTTIIGRVTETLGRVIMRTAIGSRRLIDLPQGEILPRIC